MIPFSPSLPNIKECDPVRAFRIGNYLAILVKNPKPFGEAHGIGIGLVEYLYTLAVMLYDNEDVALMITAERSGYVLRDMIKDAHDEDQNTDPFLCIFNENGSHTNLGSSPELVDIDTFCILAVKLARQYLSIDDIPVEIKIKSKTDGKPALAKGLSIRILTALFNVLGFSRKRQAAWNSIMAAYTFEQLTKENKDKVINKAIEIESSVQGSPVSYTEIVAKMNNAQRYHLISLAMMNCNIQPSLGRDLWYEVKNPHIDLLAADSVIASTKRKIEREFKIKLPQI